MYKPIKTLGQNFLMDKSVVRDMVNVLGIENGDEIIEIGSGHGVVTEALIEEVRYSDSKIYAVEVDERFCKKLSNLYNTEGNIQVFCEDILQWLPRFSTEKDFKIIGSLPYYITSPIIHGIIKMKKMPKICVLLVQKEVAEKIKSKVPDSSYMSSFAQTFFDVSYLGKVPRKRFKPEPDVDGGILKLTRRNSDFTLDFIIKYEGFLHKAFSNPRKMLNKVFTKEELQKGGIDPTLRAQNLSADEWLNFYRILNEI